MLAQEVAAEFPGKVRFVSENFGASKLAERFGVTRYPAVFVDDVLVARPRDFGFFGTGDKAGRYTPWVNAESQARFKTDLKRMIELVLAGKKQDLRAETANTKTGPDEVSALPPFKLVDLAGHPLTSEQVQGRAVLVEFWATWCPPCHSTLRWLGQLKGNYGDKLAVLALAVESPDDKVRAEAAAVTGDIAWAVPDAATAQSFGDVGAVPTVLLFDRSGKSAGAVYGAPPDLHEQIEKKIKALIE